MKPRKSLDVKAPDTYGRHIIEMCKETGLRILNGRTFGDVRGNYTCFTPRGNSVIDYALVDCELINKVKYFTVDKMLNGLSDHCKIEVFVKCNFKRKGDESVMHKLPPKRRWDENKRNVFLETLNDPEVVNDIDCLANDIERGGKCINNDTDALIQIFNKIMKRVFPIKKKCRRKKTVNKKWYDKDCESAKREIKRMGKVLVQSPDNVILRQKYLMLVRKYNRMLRAKKRNFKNVIFERLETLHSSNPKEYWKLFGDLKKEEGNRDNSSAIPISEWKNYLVKLFGPKDIAFSKQQEMLNKLKNLENISIFNELNYIIKRSELDYALAKAKLNKAVGIDGISVEMLKYSSEKIKMTILALFNKIFSTGNYPKGWNLGYVSTLHKAGNKDNPDNYRCLTIISCLAKIFGTILNNRLQEFLEKHELLKNTQIGFKKKARTQDHMFVLKALIDKYKVLKKDLYICFVDFSKAYDNVWRNALLYKLLLHEIGGNFYNCIKNMYAETLCAVKEGDCYSDAVETMIGVRQGDPLSPALFNIFTNDIPELFDDDCDPILLKESKLHCLQYADDIVLMSESAEGLQGCLNKLEKYCDLWEMKVNTVKTQVMVFSGKRKPIHQFKLNGSLLNIVDEYKYLGCVFSSCRNFKKCVELLSDKARRATFGLKKILKYNDMSPTQLFMLFDKMILPILTYGAEIWGGSFYKKIDKLKLGDSIPGEKVHRQFIKYVLGVHSKASNSAILAETGRIPVFANVLKLFTNYANRLKCADVNSLLYEANVVALELESKKAGWWYEYNNIIKDLNFTDSVVVNGQMVHQKIGEKYRDNILNDIKNSKKLRTYSIVKENVNYEVYLNVLKNSEHRKLITRFRISAHDLNIERGRYKGLALAERKCVFCENVEDEKHFLLVCKNYDDVRQPFLNELYKENCNLKDLNDDMLFVYLLTNENDLCNKILGKLLAALNNYRSDKIKGAM
jgi:hypothetical protein